MEGETFNFLDYWPPTVLDLIFQHLSGKEVLSATKVHRTWNDFISVHSMTCWKDICIQPKVSDDLKFLVSSQRRFQHLKAVNISTIVPQLVQIITKPGRKWKSIVIFRTVFRDKSDVASILQASAKFIERLDLNTLATENPEASTETSKTSFKFPHLKILKISCHFLDESPVWINSMIESAPKLEFLHLANASDCTMKNLIVSSPNLKKLSLSGKFQDVNFFQDLSLNLSSRLEEFEFNDILSSSENDQNLRYFNHFFKSQSSTMKKFETDALLELDEFESAFAMPNLQMLSIKSFHYNREILNILIEEWRTSNIPEASLKVLNVQLMDQVLLDMLALHARGLEKLRADELAITDASNPAWFPKLKEVQVFFMSPHVEKSIKDKAETDRSHLERLILDGIVDLSVSSDFSQEVREFLDAIDD